ncbi:MAG: TIGR00725 family protein [Candidatus Omnitrophica bacterium]|nr:TIGR00725 family protein [Candidatus Omnitrophota bacterium]MDD5351636.1 TIGR00725 family protein [Candidatus Omnitrophota bacterium]MDD5550846.1 TIGR00725 family protein [Candidatus Omnitrophota bacterium]
MWRTIPVRRIKVGCPDSYDVQKFSSTIFEHSSGLCCIKGNIKVHKQKLLIAVIGGHKCNKKTEKIAKGLGREIANLGAILVCGGLGGVMQAAAKGAKEFGGITVGILPTDNKNDANPYIDIPIATGLGYTRNTLVTTAADIIIALPGEYGTLSEMGFALNAKKTVISLGSWKIKGAVRFKSVKQAIEFIKRRFLNA